jgi:hypothetical protein
MNTPTNGLARHARAALLAATAAFAVLAANGCGNVTAGGLAEVTVDVSGDAPAPAPAPTATVMPAPARSSHEITLEGDVEVDFTLALVSETGSVQQLVEDDVRVEVDVQGDNEAQAVSTLVPPARYTELRMTFTRVRVQIISGLPIIGPVDVEIEEPLLVARPLDLEAQSEGSVAMLVDLNAPAWLVALDPLTRKIDPAVFASLVEVVVR